jgi:hypothetical protein
MSRYSESGRRGGLATFAKHGRAHMAAIGKRGALTFWKRYQVHPAGTSGWAIIRRATGEVVNTIGSLPARIKTAMNAEHTHGGKRGE